MALLAAFNAATGTAQQIGALAPFLNALGQAVNWVMPVTLPSPGEVIKAALAGTMPYATAARVLAANGISFSAEGFQALVAGDRPAQLRVGYQGIWREVMESQVATGSPGELLQMLNQEILSRDQFNVRMKLQGFWYADYRDELVRLAQNQIPGPGDLVRFALKDVWNADAVARFSYDAEFPPEFKFWMKRQGMDGDSRTGAQREAGAAEVSWAEAYWRSHWANISPTQAYEMFQRLRPDRIGTLFANIPGLRAFTFDDLLQVLRINDYPVPYRAQLAAIAYHKPRLVDIDRFFLDGTIDENEVYQMHLDLGYAPRDARLRTNWLAQKGARKLTGNDPKLLARTFADLYENGKLTYAEAFGRIATAFTGHWLEVAEADNDSDAGKERWRKWGPQIGQLLDARLARANLRRTRLLLASWRRQYLKGMVNAAQLRQDMLAAQFVGEFIDDFTSELNAELASGRLMLSTSKIRKLVVEGILPIETATKYLQNLGWKNPELGYLLAQVKRDLDIEHARAQERLADGAAAQEQAQIRQAKLAEKARLEVVKKLNRQAGAAALKKYFVRGIITETDFQRELERRGFDAENVKRQIQAARIDREKYLAGGRARIQTTRRGTPIGAAPPQATAQGAPESAAPP